MGWCKKCTLKAQKEQYGGARLDKTERKYGRGSKWHQEPRRIVGDFTGNNELLIYMDLSRDDGISNVVSTEQVRKAQTLANESGNPKVWTADRHSQEFLRSLIPQ